MVFEIDLRQNSSDATEWLLILGRHKDTGQKNKETEVCRPSLVENILNSVQVVHVVKNNFERFQLNWMLFVGVILLVGEKQLEEMTMDELDELEDEEDERVLLEYRQRRINEMKAAVERARYGEVNDIRAEDYVEQVNNAGEGVWVVLHLYKSGIPQCALINQHLSILARKFPATKFLRSISATCIPNYPDKNLPTIFVYFEGNMKKQFIGPHELRGTSLSCEELEWMLGQAGAVQTQLEEDPRPKVRDVLFSRLNAGKNDLSDDNDWHL
ncbi:hypothetical protein PR048_006397 [Dryococelus australis]|uniref:Phosducin domain-containing protein n=1 Tax=Dryococelus australis TaxID=614101 RepID=A0ABQ9IBW5_9NEOP|nr:hypothetical protein PR048_006397 [Dryococelus australis]